MANANVPYGLRPINDKGMPWVGKISMARIPASQGTNIFIGDPVVPLGTCDANGVPDIGIATAGATNTVLGSVIGPCNGPAGSGLTLTRDMPLYHPASVAGYVTITDDPNQIYAIQEDSVGGAIAATNASYANANLVAGAGSTVTGWSGWMLQSSSVAAASPTFQLRLLGIVRAPDNAMGAYADWFVRINLPALWALPGY